MSENLLQQLQAKAYRLRGVELKLATLILQDPKAFTGYSMAEVAALAGVSQGSIVNFSKTFADGGFPKLKLRIAAALANYQPQPFSRIETNDGVAEVLRKRSDDVGTAFSNTLRLNPGEALERIADRILNARKVEIYGIYRSAVSATGLYYHLLELGIPAAFVSDTLSCSVSASMLEEHDLIIAISSTGQTKEILDAVKIARQRQVPVIGLTSHPDSALARLSDDLLIAGPSGNALSGHATEIMLSNLLLIDGICSYLSGKIQAESGLRYLQMKEILNSHCVD